MGASEMEKVKYLNADCRLWVDDPKGFTTHKVGRLHHTYHQHPLFQLPELEALAQELVPFKQCRFVRPGITQASAFAHDSQHPDGRSIEEVFRRIEEPGSWIALYDVEVIPRYQALLHNILDNVRATIDREQPGMFLVTGFIFISAPPSVTPFHIDRENNFWLMLHGRKVMNVWDRTDRVVVPQNSVEDYIVAHEARKIRLKDEFRARSHEFVTLPGDGIYFPSTSPHMTRSDPGWEEAGEGVAISVGVNFYTSVTRRTARLHQVNRLMRSFGLSPAYPGESPAVDAVKAPLGKLVGATRWSLRRLRRPGRGDSPPPGSF
jgi:hypothetical protein